MKPKLKKRAFLLFSITISLVVVLLLICSPLAKYLIEKYDEEFTGRKIELDWAYVNPFTGGVHLNDVKIYEYQSDSIFLSVKNLNADFAMLKLFSGIYEVSSITLHEPNGIFIQNQDKRDLNINDLIERFAGEKDDKPKKKKSPVKLSIMDIVIDNGEFHYRENQVPINYFIKKVNITSGGFRYDTDTIGFRFQFLPGIGTGTMSGNMLIHGQSKDYSFTVKAREFDLQIIEQFLRDLTAKVKFSAKLDGEIASVGNFEDYEKVSYSGNLAINDFHFGKTRTEDYAAFDKLTLAINQLNPKKLIYYYDSISLINPYVKYERYDHLDNLQVIFGKKGAAFKSGTSKPAQFNLVIVIGNYLKNLSQNFFKSHYKINRLAVYNGNFKYNDFSTPEKFSADLHPFFVSADSVDKDKKIVSAVLRSGIKPYGNMAVDFSISPSDSSDFDFRYHLQKIPTAMFNPYLVSLTSFPLDRGTVELKGNWKVRDGIINSDNHILVIDPRVGNRVRNEDNRWIPMRLLMFFVREKGNVIDYEVPITGDMKKPSFSFKDVIFDVLENIFVKPVSTPYRATVKHAETEIENFMHIKWKVRSAELEPGQENFIEEMVEFLEENPEARISVQPSYYELREKEAILFFEAKKKYYRSIHPDIKALDEKDSLRIDKMSVKDTLFILYLNKHNKGEDLLTVQQKCMNLLDSAYIHSKYAQLNKNRMLLFMEQFKESGVSKQVVVGKSRSLIPYNGYSYLKINYKEKLPETLVDAYYKMTELNDKLPRKKYKRERSRLKRLKKTGLIPSTI